MPLYVWLALLLVVGATVGGTALLVVRALALWRTFKGFGRALGETLARLDASTARLAHGAENIGSDLPRLDGRMARLRTDLARFAVLRAAAQDVRDSFGRILAVYPRK